MLEIRSPNRGGSIGGGTSHSSGGTLPTSHPTSERHPACERCVRLCTDLSWTIKKAEHPRIDAFELWCWRRLLRVSWTTRRSNRSILKEISPEYSLEELMLKLQYSGHLMRRTHWKRTWCWERLKEGEKGTTENEMVGWHHRLNGHEFEKAPGVGDGQGSLACCSPWVAKSQTQLSN